MGEPECLDEIVEHIYEAPIAPAEWADVLWRCAVLLGASAASLVLRGEAGARVEFGRVVRRNPPHLGLYPDDPVREQIWVSALRRLSEGRIYTSRQLSRETDVAEPGVGAHGPGHGHGADFWTAVLRNDRIGLDTVSFHQVAAGRGFRARERELMRRLLPHLRRAIAIQRRLAAVNRRYRDPPSPSVFEHLPHAVFGLAGDGRVLFTSRRAAAVLALQDGIRVSPDGLVCDRTTDGERLHRLIAQVREKGASGNDAVLALPRPSGRRAFGILVTPVPAGALEEGLRLLVFVSDPEARSELREQTLRRLFGLTRSEARLAAALAVADDLRGAAAQVGVTELTARTYLKHIFTKTGTHRQTELLRLIATSVATLASPG